MRIKIPIGKLLLALIFIATTNGCKSDKNNFSAPRVLNISIAHDNDRSIAEWLNSAIAPFQKEISASFPDINLHVSLSQQSTILSIEDVASGRIKSDAILLPHPGYAKIISSKVRNLGSPVSDCRTLIGSPYVAIAPRKHILQILNPLGREIPDINEALISITISELEKLLQQSHFAYTHPRRSARGQFGLLLSLASTSSDQLQVFGADGKAKQPSNIGNLKHDSQRLNWLAPSDSQLISSIAMQNNNNDISGPQDLNLGLLALRQLESRPELKDSISVLLPNDRTIWEQHSLCISEADWVSPIKKTILEKFQAFLLSQEMLASAASRGFKPAYGNQPLSPASIELSPSAQELSNEFLATMEKPFALALAIDTSATMNSENLAQIQEFIRQIFSTSPADSQIDLIRFSSEVEVLGNRENLKDNLQDKLNSITLAGGSSIYDSLLKQFEPLAGKSSATRRRVALIITDGNDNTSVNNLDQTLAAIKQTYKSTGYVALNVILITSGNHAEPAIQKIIDASGGTLYMVAPTNLYELLSRIQEAL